MFVYSQSSSVIQLFSISFILPSSIYIKLIPYSVQFQNHFFSIILPNHQHHVSSNRFIPRKKISLFINNPQYFQDSKIRISDFIVESFFPQFSHDSNFLPGSKQTWQIFPFQRDKIDEDLLENALGGFPDLDDKEGSSAELDEQLDPLSGWFPQLWKGDQVDVAQDGAYDEEHHADGG